MSFNISLQDIPTFFEPTAPLPVLPTLLCQTEIGKMQSSDALLGQEELRTGPMRHERSKVRFAPYPSGSRKQNSKSLPVESNSDFESDLSSLSSSDSGDLEDDDLISKPEGEAGRPGRGGYNLEESLGWPTKEYRRLKVRVVLHFIKLLLNLSNRNISRNLSTSTLFSTRIFLLNLWLPLPLFKLWYVSHACLVDRFFMFTPLGLSEVSHLGSLCQLLACH
jgi:hypothetical protein